MIRKIIKINEDKCTGCSLCIDACHEGAIKLINGKAKLIRDDYCDGLGDCLPVCPTNAISFEEREATPYNEEAVKQNMLKNKTIFTGCPSSMAKSIKKNESNYLNIDATSQLSQWPVQIKLVPVNAPYFYECDLLIAADCTAFAYGDFHNKFIKNRVTLIGCPKLDATDYSEKLSEIIKFNNIKSITVVKMQVPCCTGIEIATKSALESSMKNIPLDVVTITPDGKIL